jgi:DNA-binding beta-propeller fold protein YncE
MQRLILPGIMVFFALAARFASGDAAAKSYLLVANKADHALGIVDPESGRMIANVDEGGFTGHEVIASPDGRFAYVPVYGDSGVGKAGSDGTSLVVIDLAAHKVTGSLDFGHGVRPHCPQFGPTDGMLYVTTELDEAISVIDPHTMKIAYQIPTGQKESHMLAITRDGKRGYTANVGPGTVSVLDLVARKTVAVIPISRETQRISLSADDRMAFTSDQTKPRLAVIDTATNTVKQWVPLPGLGYGTAATADGRYLLVAVPPANKAAVVDLHTMQVARSIDVPRAPQEVLVAPDQRHAYVSCDASGQVAEISLADWSVKLIGAGKGADGLAWAGK